MRHPILAAIAFLLVLIVVAPDARAQQSSPSLSPAQKEEVESLIGDYIRKNPRIILEAIEILKQQERQAQEDRVSAALARLQDQLIKEASSPVGGNPDGDVTIVEFFDYRCGYCKKVLPAIVTLLERDKKLRYVLKELPILSPESELAARAALAAWRLDRGKYLAYHTALMQAQGNLSERRILRLARNAGLDSEKIANDMEHPKVEEELKRNIALAEQLGIRGTPAFVIGDRLIPGVVDLPMLEKTVAEVRKKK